MRQHHDRERRGNQRREDDRKILQHGKHVACRQAAAPFKPHSAHVYHQQRSGVEQKRDGGVNQRHRDVGTDDVVRHDAGCAGDALVGGLLPVKGPDHTDTPDPLAHQSILLVTVVVRQSPQACDLPAEQQNAAEDQRDHHQNDQGQARVLAQTHDHPAQKHQRDDQGAAAEHGDDPVEVAHVVGRARDQVGHADAAQLFKGHGVDLGKQVRAKRAGKAACDLKDQAVAKQHRRQTHKRQNQHPAAERQDHRQGVGLRRPIQALVQDLGHEVGQQQLTHRAHGHQQRGRQDPPPVRRQIVQQVSQNIPPFRREGRRRGGRLPRLFQCAPHAAAIGQPQARTSPILSWPGSKEKPLQEEFAEFVEKSTVFPALSGENRLRAANTVFVNKNGLTFTICLTSVFKSFTTFSYLSRKI